jgi:hypothetical protein
MNPVSARLETLTIPTYALEEPEKNRTRHRLQLANENLNPH